MEAWLDAPAISHHVGALGAGCRRRIQRVSALPLRLAALQEVDSGEEEVLVQGGQAHLGHPIQACAGGGQGR